MSVVDQLFWWTGAVIAICACVIAASLCLYAAGVALKKACNYWWERTLTIYRLESIRHYFWIMVENGRTGLLEQVENSKREAEQAKNREQQQEG